AVHPVPAEGGNGRAEAHGKPALQLEWGHSVADALWCLGRGRPDLRAELCQGPPLVDWHGREVLVDALRARRSRRTRTPRRACLLHESPGRLSRRHAHLTRTECVA